MSALVQRDRAPRATVAAVVLAVVVFVAVLLWSKWFPYVAKAVETGRAHGWSGSNILATGGVRPGDPPSWDAAVSFLWAYASAVWKALVAALLISASLQALVPRAWLLRALNRRGRFASALAGGVASSPSMMCTCCTAPVAVTLRRNGVSTAAAVAYWLGNPLLNPAVLVFLLLVAPWQWTATRLVVGALTVFAGAALVAMVADRPGRAPVPVPPDPEPVAGGAGIARRFVGSLSKLALVLVPEYLVMVLLVGAFRGWLLGVGGLAAGVLAVLVVAVVGTLAVIPTAGEIPIAQGLALIGVSTGVLGALLITLPAVSAPGVAMVARSFGWRATVATTVLVIVAGVLGGAMLSLVTN
ncbi:permease [Pseudonocardia acaciae]|uniref:permease n=1 Tax=Pseudonocardia acaciae TaxID=551276 RepID=UPI001B803D89|nr:permease [Pseudonocardia acaciae]